MKIFFPPIKTYQGKGKDELRGEKNNDNSHWDLMICKTITYQREAQMLRVVYALEKLMTEKFPSIKIPRFDFSTEGLVLRYYAQYVKGIPISKWELLTLYDELVERDSDHSFTDYSFGNFIKNDDGIWAVDLNSYSETPVTIRRDLWNRRFQKA